VILNLTKLTARYKAPAKINIRLKITGRRSDGYHELVTVMVPVNLFDILEIKSNSKGIIDLNSEGFEVPTDSSNLSYRAAASFFSQTGLREGISIDLKKNIPVSAGLGGGSSDAAGTLIALNNMYSRPLSDKDLHNMAVKLGADVPFFLKCVPSLATGIGDILEPIENWPKFYYLIITPPVEISTSWVYRNYKMELTSNEYDYIYTALKNNEFIISDILENDLEKVTSTSFPIINTLKTQLMDAGAEGAIMSGSGSSVFGVFSSHEKAVETENLLKTRDLGDIFLVNGGIE
jgi:4-diphosphocytidyl-2-C-methyl-D-erythritol kinase